VASQRAHASDATTTSGTTLSFVSTTISLYTTPSTSKLFISAKITLRRNGRNILGGEGISSTSRSAGNSEEIKL
ncbi:hypothetical protein SCHPADRAFT_996083, partial [Schizopora paradoxa]